jgi:hypothetical protein
VSRVVSWFSCGAASAVATKLALSQFAGQEIVIARCLVDEEHEDNDRFAADCERWFGQPIVNLKSEKYGSSIVNVFDQRKYMSGVAGAPCTLYLKKEVRRTFQRHDDLHVFGYTADSKDSDRWDAFLDANNISAVAPLIERGLQHADCLAMVESAGIALPAMYLLGYEHNNCKGCVKAKGAGYWNKVRQDFPIVFHDRAAQSRRIGCKLVEVDGERIFLDELPFGVGRYQDEPEIQCGIFCEMAQKEYAP